MFGPIHTFVHKVSTKYITDVIRETSHSNGGSKSFHHDQI